MLLGYDLLQERIVPEPYGTEMLHISAFLVFCSRTLAVLCGVAMAFAEGEPGWSGAPCRRYPAVFPSSVGASFCQCGALRYVACRGRTLGKSFKTMPARL